MPQKLVLRCPTCRELVAKDHEHFPFCSDRCRLIDLGKWASGEYRISSPVLDPEVIEGLGEEQRPNEDDDDSGSH